VGKDMKRRVVGIVLFTSFFLFSIIWNSTAQTGTSQTPIGVKVGDEFTFSSHLSRVSGVPSESASAFYLQYDSLEWFKLTFSTIVNTSFVDYGMVFHFNDGTESSSGPFRGGTYLDGGGGDFLVFPSSLIGGDSLYPFPADEDARSYIISETVPVVYAEGSRMTNHVTVADFGHHLPKGDLYFDKETGILVEYICSIPQSTDSAVAALIWTIKLTGSNVWSVGSSPSITPSATLKPTLQPSSTTNTTPTPSILATPTSSQSIATNYWLNSIALIVIAFLLAVIIFLLFYIRKRRTIDSKSL
jgi:hypothetical protein